MKNTATYAGRVQLYLFALVLSMFAGGSLFAWWLAVRTDRDLRANLLQQTRMVTKAVDIDQIKTLTGTEADRESPTYLRLKERFAAVNSANQQSRFVYLLGRRTDGTVFFFLDSEPVGAKDESPAGQIYNEVSPEYLRAFDTQTELVTKPISDRWGDWISVLVPLTDSKNGKLIAVLGMDYDARSWKWKVAAKVALPIILTLMLLGITVLAIILAESHRQILAQQETLRKSEEKYCMLNKDLELKVEERTNKLMEAKEELARREKLAILGQLSGSVGHELRNPLGVMSNAVYFLKMVLTDADETTKEYLDIIKNEIDNSLRIITDLLDFARTRSPHLHSVAPGDLVRQNLEKCAFPENVAVTVDLPEAVPNLHVDPAQLGQVLQNLIMNAVQAMPGGGALRVAARLVEAGLAPASEQEGLPLQDCVEISVSDNGEGISPENMKKLFQPLFTTKAKGIGLGLVVCKNLVEANGGRIEVASEPEQGTTFTVYLPVVDGEGSGRADKCKGHLWKKRSF